MLKENAEDKRDEKRNFREKKNRQFCEPRLLTNGGWQCHGDQLSPKEASPRH
jgi:hypothetical protein